MVQNEAKGLAQQTLYFENPRRVGNHSPWNPRGSVYLVTDNRRPKASGIEGAARGGKREGGLAVRKFCIENALDAFSLTQFDVFCL
jgi:hypothetical protein